jgi:hypothetical protein
MGLTQHVPQTSASEIITLWPSCLPRPATPADMYSFAPRPSQVCLMVTGLMYINASVWMLLRGGGIVFVAFMKQFILGNALSPSMWAGVAIITLAAS